MTEKYESLVQRQDFGNQARNSMGVRQQRLIRAVSRPGSWTAITSIQSGSAASQDRKIEADAPA